MARTAKVASTGDVFPPATSWGWIAMFGTQLTNPLLSSSIRILSTHFDYHFGSMIHMNVSDALSFLTDAL